MSAAPEASACSRGPENRRGHQRPEPPEQHRPRSDAWADILMVYAPA